jgi:membrane-bound lytic murein transglycosylase D
VDEQFSGYHEALSGAADRLMAATSSLEREAAPLNAGGKDTTADQNLVRQFAQQYWDGQEENVRRAVARVVGFRPTLEPILRQEGIPLDVVALVLVESGGRTTALSPKGALGLWQFMPETARRYGLEVGPRRDDRLDVVKSTRAAARYLRDLHSQFGDWNLAFAAYNAGEQAVRRALQKDGVHEFEKLSRGGRLPLETRNYVPAVISAIRLLGGSTGQFVEASRARSVRVLYADVAVAN